MSKLSKRAEKMLRRVQAGEFYKLENYHNSPAMRELLDAGLVTTTGRVVIIEACFVPAVGYTPFTQEKFDGEAA